VRTRRVGVWGRVCDGDGGWLDPRAMPVNSMSPARWVAAVAAVAAVVPAAAAAAVADATAAVVCCVDDVLFPSHRKVAVRGAVLAG
jgi:hypothetical protein